MFGINAVGRRTGEAIAVLEAPDQVDLALRRHRHYMNQRYVEVPLPPPSPVWVWSSSNLFLVLQVYDATPRDFLAFAEPAGEGDGASTEEEDFYVVRMQGLPYRATEAEIVSLKEGAGHHPYMYSV